MQEGRIFLWTIAVCLTLLFIYKLIFGIYAGRPNREILKNTKYGIGTVTSIYYNNRTGRGNDFKFFNGKYLFRSRAYGEFKQGRSYLVAFDSLSIKNGFLILDAFDITDSLPKYHMYPRSSVYDETWSLEKMPFQYDKSDIEYYLRMNIPND